MQRPADQKVCRTCRGQKTVKTAAGERPCPACGGSGVESYRTKG